MALSAMADNGVNIKTVRDAVLYDALAGHKDVVFGEIGNELECTVANLEVTMKSGMCLIQGRHVVNEGTENVSLPANSNGYVVLRYDLSQVPGEEIELKAIQTGELTNDDLNNNGIVRDLLLYQYSSTGTTATLIDKRVIKKDLGSLDPATLTATQKDVLSGKIFGGSGSDEPQTGTMPNRGDYGTAETGLGFKNTDTEKYVSIKKIQPGYYPENLESTWAPEIRVKSSLFGNAEAKHVLNTKTFTSSNGANIQGTMVNRNAQTDAVSIGIGTGNYSWVRIPNGGYITNVTNVGYPEIVLNNATLINSLLKTKIAISTSTSSADAGGTTGTPSGTFQRTIKAAKDGVLVATYFGSSDRPRVTINNGQEQNFPIYAAFKDQDNATNLNIRAIKVSKNDSCKVMLPGATWPFTFFIYIS